MPKSNEFANKVKNSSHVSTLAHDTGKVFKVDVRLEEILKTASLLNYQVNTFTNSTKQEAINNGRFEDLMQLSDSTSDIIQNISNYISIIIAEQAYIYHAKSI